MTHPQAKPTRVTDFQNIERITTSVLPASSSQNQKDAQSSSDQSNHKSGKDSSNGSSSSNNVQNGSSGKVPSSPSMNKKSDKRSINTCNCNEIKTLLKIKVTGNLDDLVITCNGVKSAESIADLVDGYCRIVNNTEMTLWDRASANRTPGSSATNSLEKITKQLPSQPTKNADHIHSTASEFSSSSTLTEASSGPGTNALKPSVTSNPTTNFDMNMPILSEDYVDIGLGEEEGDYSTPAARNYELDRTQITLNEIIGIGQFGDVHIGTCRINKAQKLKGSNDTATGNDDSSQKDGSNGSTNGSENDKNTIHVAVKTCKADADLITSEKFLEEACKH